jgi:multiple sugar transport system permease protein
MSASEMKSAHMMSRQTRGLINKRINRFLGYLVLVVVTIVVTLPVIALLLASLKQDAEVIKYPIVILPSIPQWSNYLQVFVLTDFLNVAARTFALAAGTTAMGVIVNSMVGFAFSRYHVPGSKQLFGIIISLLIVPGIVTLIPQFLVFARLKMTGTYWPWILGALSGSPFYIFLFRQFFSTFPRELEEAAEVDGCSPFRIYAQIFMPNAQPIIAVAAFFAFGAVWGNYLEALIYLRESNTLLGVIMATGFKNPHGITYTTISMAANVYYILPMVIVFFFAQKNILKGVITSGLKG